MINHRFGKIGLTHKHDGLRRVGLFSLAADRVEYQLKALAEHAHCAEILYVGTCNRSEIYFVAAKDTSAVACAEQLWQKWQELSEIQASERSLDLPSYCEGTKTARHLLRVVCGLESMVLGDTGIRAQFKHAMGVSERLGFLGPVLRQALDHAFRTMKHVSTQYTLSDGPTSVSMAAARFVRQQAPVGSHPRITFLGAGETIEQAALHIAARKPKYELHFVNRTESKALALADKFGGTSQALAAWLEKPQSANIVITALALAHPLIDERCLEKLQAVSGVENLFFVDLGIPHNVAPTVAQAAGVTYLDIEKLGKEVRGTTQTNTAVVQAAELYVEHQVHELEQLLRKRQSAPMVSEMLSAFNDPRQHEVERFVTQSLSHLSAEDQNRIRNWSKHLTATLARAWAEKSGTEHAASNENNLGAFKENLCQAHNPS